VDAAIERLTQDNNSIYFQLVSLGVVENIELPALEIYTNKISEAGSITLRLL